MIVFPVDASSEVIYIWRCPINGGNYVKGHEQNPDIYVPGNPHNDKDFVFPMMWYIAREASLKKLMGYGLG